MAGFDIFMIVALIIAGGALDHFYENQVKKWWMGAEAFYGAQKAKADAALTAIKKV